MKSYLSDYVAQKRLQLQQENNSLSREKMHLQQSNFERNLQANFENEQRKNEANIQIAKIQAQNNLELATLNNLLQGMNQTTQFFQSEFAKQTAHNLELQKISHETRATSILERLKNNAEINKAKLNAKIEIERMLQENEIKKDYLTFEGFSNLFFRLLEREMGLNSLEANAQNIETYVKQAYEQMGLKNGYSPYG